MYPLLIIGYSMFRRLNLLIFLFSSFTAVLSQTQKRSYPTLRQLLSINEGWSFMRYTLEPDTLVYDERPTVAVEMIM
jgi:hypothetical protein